MDLQGAREAAKPIYWCGSSLDDLRAFPESVRARAGKELRKMQFGLDPTDVKRVSTWGAGVIEIRLDEDANTWRVACVAKFEEAVYVLHSFSKKERKTRLSDAWVIRQRYHEIVNQRRSSR